MSRQRRHPLMLLICLIAPALLAGCGGPEREIEEKLKEHVLLFVNFGDKRFEAITIKKGTVADMETSSPPRHESTGGKVDGFISFANDAGYLRYRAEHNFPYRPNSAWSGAVSFWLSVDPVNGLKANFPEPFHIGRKWDDAIIFVDFDKKQDPPALRFGCYPDKAHEGDLPDEMVDQRVVRVENPNWKPDEWHHVVITWSNFNSGQANAEWALFVDGEEKGRKKNLRQTLTWDMDQRYIEFNPYKYTGKLDEVAIFDTMLAPRDVKYLYKPRRPLSDLLKKDRP